MAFRSPVHCPPGTTSRRRPRCKKCPLPPTDGCCCVCAATFVHLLHRCVVGVSTPLPSQGGIPKISLNLVFVFVFRFFLFFFIGLKTFCGDGGTRILAAIGLGFILTVVGFKVVVPDDPYADLNDTYLEKLKGDDDVANDAARKVRRRVFLSFSFALVCPWRCGSLAVLSALWVLSPSHRTRCHATCVFIAVCVR